MGDLCKGDIAVYPVTANKIYDISRATNKISSNISVKFDILNNVSLPRNTKIDIVETQFEYTFKKIEKNSYINGHKVDNLSNCLQDTVCIKDKYVNLLDNSCSTMILNVTERLKVEIGIKIKIKGVAYTNNCGKICFEAVGVGKDNIETIIVSNIYVPNIQACFDKGVLNMKNDIIGLANPEYIFLSPLFDCCGCIEFLMGNVFINYCTNLDISCIIPSDLSVLAYTKNYEI